MVRGQMKKCPICDTDLRDDSEACPNCGTDSSLFDIELDSEDLAAIKSSKSLDDLLASVLEDSSLSPPKKKPEKETLDDLDLELPEEPPDRPKLDLDILEEDILGKEEKSITFECPACGAEVEEQASQCPSCGALFAEGGAFNCPTCGSSVPVDASRCPRCGVRFVDDGESASRSRSVREPGAFRSGGLSEGPTAPARQQLRLERGPSGTGEIVKEVMAIYETQKGRNPLLVGDRTNLTSSLRAEVGSLKTLLALAKRLRVPVGETQRAISEATTKAKANNLSAAVKLAWGARVSLEQSLAVQIAQRVEFLREDLRTRQGRGQGVPMAGSLAEEVVQELKGGRVSKAYEKLQLAREDLTSKTSGTTEARYALQAAEEIVREVAQLGVGVVSVQEILGHGREALRRGDWETASRLAATAQEKATEALRRGVAAEMKKAKQLVMELKMRGHDVSEPIQLLKQASASTKEESYSEALRYLTLFKRRVGAS